MIAAITATVTLAVCSLFYGFYKAGERAGARSAAKTLVLMLNSAAIGADSKASKDPFEILKRATETDVN